MKIELGYNQKRISVEVAPEHFGAILKLNDENDGKCKKNAAEITKEAVNGSFEKFMALPMILPSLEGKKGVLHMEKYTSKNADVVFNIDED